MTGKDCTYQKIVEDRASLNLSSCLKQLLGLNLYLGASIKDVRALGGGG